MRVITFLILTSILSLASTVFAGTAHITCTCEGRAILGLVIQKEVSFQSLAEMQEKLDGLGKGVHVHYDCRFNTDHTTASFSGSADGR